MTENKGILLILATAVISGLVIFISKFSVSVVNPYIFTGLKNIIVALMIIGWLVAAKDRNLLKQLGAGQWLQLVLVGLIGGSIPFLLFFKGLSLTSAVQAAFIHKTMVIFVIVLAVVFLKERVSRGLLIGIFALIIGNIFLLEILGHELNLGSLLILMAAILWAIENVLSKHLLENLPSRVVIWARMTFGSIFIVFFWLITGQAHLVVSLSLAQIGWTFLSAIILLAYVVTWYTGLKYVRLSIAATILMIGSTITSILTIMSSGLGINTIQLIAALLNVLFIGFIIWPFLKIATGFISRRSVA